MKIDPVIFTSGQSFYKGFGKKYVQHNNGLFILAPSGSGKTHFCKIQKEPHWIDGDEIWMSAGAHPDGAWWKEPLETLNRVDQRSDVITMEAMKLGFWIMGASCYWLEPSAIVIPEWETHKKYIKHRQQTSYDGGATEEDHQQVLGHIAFIKTWHTDHGVPMFDSIEKAVSFLTKK